MNPNNYWSNKDKNAELAKEHTKEMQEKYANDTTDSIINTIMYSADQNDNLSNNQEMEILIEDLDTVHAGSKYCNDGKVALLNFASYTNPGGRFLQGSKAQEECLCHSSNLYNVLSKLDDFYNFYKWNRENRNNALYLNRGLYSPHILFQYKEKSFYCDVITCAAPNKFAAQKYKNISDEENTKALESRIKFVLKIAKENQVDTLILGAYGCGVFGQNPYEVASIFKKYLETTYRCFKKVIFAIPGTNINLKAFKEIFEGGTL